MSHDNDFVMAIFYGATAIAGIDAVLIGLTKIQAILIPEALTFVFALFTMLFSLNWFINPSRFRMMESFIAFALMFLSLSVSCAMFMSLAINGQ